MKKSKAIDLPKRLTSKEFIGLPPSPIITATEVSTVYPLHWHEFYEIELICSGQGVHLVNDREYPFSRGDVFLLTPADFHEINPESKASIKLYNIKFTDDMLDDRMRAMLFGTGKITGARLQEHDFTRLLDEVGLMLREQDAPNIGSDIIIQGGLERILLELVRKNAGAAYPDTDRKFNVMQISLIYMHHHFRENLSLEDMARKAYLSANYFSECFHKLAGTSFQRYLQSLRLEFAKSLLAVSLLPISEICYTSGFNSMSHFIRTFKKNYGTSPTSFRRSIAYNKKNSSEDKSRN